MSHNTNTAERRQAYPSPVESGTSESAAPEPAVAPRRRLRALLLWAGSLLVLCVAGFFYLTGGRYVSTDNAYVKADKVAISPQVEGTLVEVDVSENQAVKKGQLLFRIDPASYEIALQQADAQLDTVRTDLLALKAQYRQSQAELQLAESNEAYARREWQRQSDLGKRKLTSQATLDQARHTLDQATQNSRASREQLARLQAQLGGDADRPIENHPRYRAALAARQRAALDLSNTRVRAPFTGVAGNTPEPGAYVKPGSAVMSLVASGNVWVEANFKETDLTHVRPGQPVTLYVDTYPDAQWHGRVASLSQATGAEFSVLPPQNATGNWVKVVQRIPVRIAVDTIGGERVLRAGMSTEVEIDTGRYPALPRFAQVLLDHLGVSAANAADRLRAIP